MATYTDNYQLEKPLYSETADVAVLNRNADKIDDILHASQVSLAPAYDQNETYNTGDVVMYEFLMYECLEDNVTGVWDATKWQRTTAGEHGGGSSASEVSYDNTDSGLTADNVQDALDEIVENIPSVEANPQGAATEELTKIEIDGTVYGIREEITGEASGAIASFADGSANPLKSLIVDINPVQEGSGDPSPTNERPLSGRSSVEVNVAGANVWDEEWEVGGIRTADGTPVASNSVRSKNFCIMQGGNSYYLSAPNTVYVFYYDQSQSYISYISTNNATITPPSNARYFKIQITGAYGTTYNNDVSINYPSTDTSYHPYNSEGTTTTITLGQTIYGGKMKVTIGELTVDRALIDMGDLYWNYDSGASVFTASIQGIKSGTYTDTNLISSLYPVKPMSYSQFDYGMRYNSATAIGVKNPSYNDATAFKTAMNGVQLVYELATPTTVTLTPTQVDSLLGNNNIWADSGDVDVVYIRDIDKAFNILWNAVMNSNSGTRSLNLMKGAISETKEDIEEPIKEEEETKEGNDENQR